MEPEKLPESSPSVATDPKQLIAIEYAAKALSTEVKTLLNGSKKNNIDEHEAKKLRKSFDQFLVDFAGVTYNISELEQIFEKLRSRIHDQVENRNVAYGKIESALEALSIAVKAGDLKQSQQLEQRIIADLNRVKGLSAQRRQKIITAVETLQPKIQKLSSWRKWGTVQAREKIILEMKQLHDNEKGLEKIAKRIQQARDQWREWDHSGEGGDHKLYQAFDQACSEAYKPCKEKFEAQRKQRQAASKHRLACCTLLEKQYEEINWREPDWRQIQQLIREQTGRWRKLSAAEFKDRKPLQQRFDQILGKFEDPLGRERKRNFAMRKGLVDEIVKLGESDDIRGAITALQPLKKQWLVTVSSGRKEEQAVWKAFTEACDQIYNKSREEKKEFDQQLESNLQNKQKLCADFEQFLQSNPADSAALSAQFNKWKEAWKEAGKIPGKQIKNVESQYKNLVSAAKKQLKSLQDKQKIEADKNLFSYADLCARAEALALGNTGNDISALNIEWSELGEIAPPLKQRLQKRFDAAITSIDDEKQQQNLIAQQQNNFDKINQYLLQLEISCEVDSPAEFSKQRMAMQISRLAAAMGKPADFKILSNRELIENIHTTGVIDPALQNSVNDRFKTCYGKI